MSRLHFPFRDPIIEIPGFVSTFNACEKFRTSVTSSNFVSKSPLLAVDIYLYSSVPSTLYFIFAWLMAETAHDFIDNIIGHQYHGA